MESENVRIKEVVPSGRPVHRLPRQNQMEWELIQVCSLVVSTTIEADGISQATPS